MATFHKNYQHALVWFRRDLRDYDHAALARALTDSRHVYCAFVFDTDILDALEDRADRRVEFIWESVRELKAALHDKGSDLIVLHGSSRIELPRLARNLYVQAVYANRDYEPAAVARDAAVAETLALSGIAFHSSKDQVIFEADEVLARNGRPYSTYTPYARQWRARLTDHDIAPHSMDEHLSSLAPIEHPGPMPSLESLGFVRCSPPTPIPPGMSGAEQLFENFQERLDDYHRARDFPAVSGPSYLSVHLRFGTLSIRSVVRHAWYMGGPGAESWLKEIIWREFYFMILHHHPRVAAGHSFKEEFDAIRWPGNDAHFAAWCSGHTGYPLVDAAMRQLNQTGYMHNRLRMLVASFLVKDLLLDWRRGEAWFARKLLDFDFAANNGGWQWAASTGCDAQPWFRIFNPVTQSEKFDPHGRFIRKYVPELAHLGDAEIHAPWKLSAARLRELGLTLGDDYPLPLVDHATQRARALALYKAAS